MHSFNELIQDLRQLVALYKTERYSLKEKRFLVIIDSLPAIIFEVGIHSRVLSIPLKRKRIILKEVDETCFSIYYS